MSSQEGAGRKVYVQGSGVVAPNGLGADFFEALAAGRSGIRSLNRYVVGPDKDAFAKIAPAFVLDTMEQGLLPSHHFLAKKIRRLCWNAERMGTDTSTASESYEALIEWLYELPTAPAPGAVLAAKVPLSKRAWMYFDAAGIVTRESLLPYVLPLSLMALRRFGRDYREEGGVTAHTDEHIADCALLALPPLAYMALVATFLAIVDAGHQGGALARWIAAQRDSGTLPDPRDPAAAIRYAHEAVPVFEACLGDAQGALGRCETFGIFLGTGGATWRP